MRKPQGLPVPFSIDWEDWFQLCLPPFDAADALDRFECRLPLATDLVLELCADLGAHATWFCLADQAQRHPSLVRKIVDAGHAIGLHGLRHRRITELDRSTFRDELAEARAILEDIAGRPVQGFRAPEWSLRGASETWWEEVRDQGFRYDASRAPLAVIGCHSRSRKAHELAPGFWELPPPVMGQGACTVPLWGWGLRLLPQPLLRWQVPSMALAGTPLVLHPWELDEHQPLLPSNVSRGHRFTHSAGLGGYGQRLRRLLKGVRLESLECWLEERGGSGLDFPGLTRAH